MILEVNSFQIALSSKSANGSFLFPDYNRHTLVRHLMWCLHPQENEDVRGQE